MICHDLGERRCGSVEVDAGYTIEYRVYEYIPTVPRPPILILPNREKGTEKVATLGVTLRMTMRSAGLEGMSPADMLAVVDEATVVFAVVVAAAAAAAMANADANTTTLDARLRGGLPVVCSSG